MNSLGPKDRKSLRTEPLKSKTCHQVMDKPWKCEPCRHSAKGGHVKEAEYVKNKAARARLEQVVWS